MWKTAHKKVPVRKTSVSERSDNDVTSPHYRSSLATPSFHFRRSAPRVPYPVRSPTPIADMRVPANDNRDDLFLGAQKNKHELFLVRRRQVSIDRPPILPYSMPMCGTAVSSGPSLMEYYAHTRPPVTSPRPPASQCATRFAKVK